MKKLKIIIKKTTFIILIMSIIFAFSGSISLPSNASNDDIMRSNNTRLIYENMELKKKLKEMKAIVIQIQKYDNILYSQILGVNFDTTDFYQYKNNNIDLVLKSHDSIFINVEERALYSAKMLATQLIKIQKTSSLFKNNKNAILYYPTIAPIKPKDFICISSQYGWRIHPIKKQILFHEGIDISANIGSKVYSTAQGRVVKIMYSKYGYGNRILIKHAYGFETLYAHMKIIYIKKGQWVQKNQLIGTVGNSGRSTGPHLHYEIHKNNEPRDPIGYFFTYLTDELLVMN